MTTRPEAKLGRRQLLSVGATVGVTTAVGGPPSGATVRQDRNGPWIPSKEFLADLPRLMEVVSLPGLAMATVEGGKVVWTRAVGFGGGGGGVYQRIVRAATGYGLSEFMR